MRNCLYFVIFDARWWSVQPCFLVVFRHFTTQWLYFARKENFCEWFLASGFKVQRWSQQQSLSNSTDDPKSLYPVINSFIEFGLATTHQMLQAVRREEADSGNSKIFVSSQETGWMVCFFAYCKTVQFLHSKN